jgi:hypothetical protein
MNTLNTKDTKVVITHNTPTTELRLKFCHSSSYTGPVNANMYRLQQAFISEEHTNGNVQVIKVWKDVPVVDANDNPM